MPVGGFRERHGLRDLGVGVGLRVPHYTDLFRHWPAVDFFEIISENFMVAGGKPLRHLDAVLDRYPVVPHGVSLNLGGPDPLDRQYLARLRALLRRVKPPYVTDHLCFCGAGGAHLHDLLPLPYTAETVARLSERARIVQDTLELPFALENPSTYLGYTTSSMPEWQFVCEVIERADIGLLLDVNNVYVSATNHGFDPEEYLRRVPHDRIVQVHLAGHADRGRYLLDTHDRSVAEPVLSLYAQLIRRAGPLSTLIEWDEDIPPLTSLLAEADRARAVRRAACAERKVAV